MAIPPSNKDLITYENKIVHVDSHDHHDHLEKETKPEVQHLLRTALSENVECLQEALECVSREGRQLLLIIWGMLSIW